MIDLYKYIYEGLLRGQEETINMGETDVERIMIEDWLDEALSLMYVTVDDRTTCISSNNKINACSFNPWYAYAEKELQLPAPDYIKFGKVNSVSMTMNKNVDFEKLPHVDTCIELFLKPFADNLKLDLSKLPIDKVKRFQWVYDSNDIIKYPKNTAIDTFIMWHYSEPYTSFGSKRFMIGFDKLKGLKCNNLAIPDIIFTKNYTDFNAGTNSLIKKGSFDFDSQPGKELLKLYDDNAIQFKNLYVFTVCGVNCKFYKIMKEKNCFSVAKRSTNLFEVLI